MRIYAKTDSERVAFFSELLTRAESENDKNTELLDRHFKQYKGSAEIDGSDMPARHVRNFTYELIESQVTSYIPNPMVAPNMWSEKNERNAKSIETLIKKLRDRLPYEKMNDIDERYNPIYGGSVWLIEWDNSVVLPRSVGEVKVSCLSPKHFIGQPNVYEVQEMEYCFIKFETTKEDIIRKYGVSPEIADEAESEESADDETATLYVCYYKNESDKVCQFIWSGDTLLSDIDDYYARKRRICKKCGKRERPQGIGDDSATSSSAFCECKKPSFELSNEDFEELGHDIILSDGEPIPAMSPVVENGRVVMEEQEQQVYEDDGSMAFEDIGGGIFMPATIKVQVPKLEPTKLPFYAPTKFPIVIRKNTSQEDSLLGQSDCEFIRPQQQAANKLESRILEKTLKSGVYPTVPDDFDGTLDNSVFDHPLRVKNGDENKYGRIDLQVDLSRDSAQSDRQYDHAKRILGISDSFQGQHDASAQSGKAKQIQINQSAGRLDSKRQMKNAAYAEMDEIIFQLYLAYADEPRMATYRDAQGNLHNRIFNRYDFLEVDESGKWYYDDDYLFSADATIDVDRQREFLWQENRQNFQSGAYGDPALPGTQLIFWQNMEKAHYPFANDNVERIKAEIERQNEIAGYQEQIKELEEDIESRAGYEQYLINKMRQGTASGRTGGRL